MDRKPNVLVFVTDQQRADHLGCYGNPDVKTPNVDRLAREGVTFTESYVANPVCMPNRATMFTGRWPSAHGVRENGIALRPEAVTLPGVLARSGYRTASFGKIHLAPFGVAKEKAWAEYERYESREWWDGGGGLPSPFYGLEHVYMVGGHGHYAFGHYRRDLDRDHPGAYAMLQKDRALVPPTGARESWKASIPEALHYNTAIADRTIDWLRSNAGAGRPPFFVWCSFPDPHHPYSPPAPWCDVYDPMRIRFSPARREGELDSLPPYVRECREGRRKCGGLGGDLRSTTDAHYREIVAHTYGMISMVDASVGRIVRALEELSLLDDTVVVFLSDHGDLMGDHWLINKGPFLFRGLVRVPTIWRLPARLTGRRERGTGTDAFMSAADLMPTVLDLCGVAAPEGVQGVSCRAVLEGASEGTRDCVYVECDESYLGDRLRQLRTREWALTVFQRERHGFLYDLARDPDELVNLWEDRAHASVRCELSARLMREAVAAADWLPPKKCHA